MHKPCIFEVYHTVLCVQSSHAAPVPFAIKINVYKHTITASKLSHSCSAIISITI